MLTSAFNVNLKITQREVLSAESERKKKSFPYISLHYHLPLQTYTAMQFP